MVKVEVVTALTRHVIELAPNLRTDDVKELKAAGSHCRLWSLWRDLLLSNGNAFAGLVDGEVVCLFGINPLNPLMGTGSIWLAASDKMYAHKIAFARRNKAKVKEMAKDYKRLIGYVHPENLVSIKWLQWLGFKIAHAPTPYGSHDNPFLKFEMEIR